MANYFVKSLLQKTLNVLLKEFFKGRSILSDFEWSKQAEGGRKVPLPETEVDGLVEAIGQLDSNDRLRVEQEFRDIRCLANEESNSCLIEQGKKPRYGVDLVEEFGQNGIVGFHDRAMWVYLYHKELFKYTYKYQQVIHTKGARDFEVGPGLICQVDEKAMGAFKKSIIKHYTGRGRGEKCVLDHCYSQERVKQHCYYIFHEDCVKSVLGFNEDATDVVRNPQPSLFENIYFYEPETGMLRIHATGEKNAEKLADLFCIHILGLEGRPTMDTRVYDLSKIKDPDFDFECDPSIEKMHIKEIVCDMGNAEEIRFRVKGREQKGLLLLERMRHVVKSYGLDLRGVTITKLRFQCVFRKEEGHRKTSRTKEIGLPNHTELSEDYYDNIIRYHIEQKWGFRRRLLADKAKTDEAA